MAKKPPMQMWIYANAVSEQVVGAWLKSYDPDENEGQGGFEVTDDRAEALVFDDLIALRDCWAAQSTVKPLRTDGKPNRPLTAYTIEARPVELGTGVPWGRQNKTMGLK